MKNKENKWTTKEVKKLAKILPKKKENWIDRNGGWLCSLLVILMLLIFSYSSYTSSPSYICSNSPEKCICREEVDCNSRALGIQYGLMSCLWNTGDYFENNDWLKEGTCIKSRLKTPSELAIDDCNSNPREDGTCKCEEYQKEIESHSNQKLLESVEIKRKEVELVSNSMTILTDKLNINWTEAQINLFFEYLYEASNYTEQTLISYKKSEIYVEVNTSNCLKSHPKTDQEKHPEYYVAEIKCIQEEDYTSGDCINLTDIQFVDLGCDDTNESIVINKTINCSLMIKELQKEYCYVRSRCIENQTTYRLKNECEKGNPNWIEVPEQGYNIFCDGDRDICERLLNEEHLKDTKTTCREKNS